jgi:hypothetical protein
MINSDGPAHPMIKDDQEDTNKIWKREERIGLEEAFIARGYKRRGLS